MSSDESAFHWVRERRRQERTSGDAFISRIPDAGHTCHPPFTGDSAASSHQHPDWEEDGM